MRCYDQTNGATPATATGLTALDVTGALMSWAAWIWFDGQNNTSCAWFHTDDANKAARAGYAVMVNGVHQGAAAQLTIRLCTASSNNAVGTTLDITGPARQWTHVGWTHNGAVLLFYRNGRFMDSKAAAFTPTVAGTRRTQIGLAGQTSPGGIFDLQVFPNVVLSPAEMAALVDPRLSVRAGDCKQRMFRNWKPGASGTIRDESGNSNNLVASATLNQCDGFTEPPWQQLLDVRPWPYYYRVSTGTGVTGTGAMVLSPIVLAASGLERMIGNAALVSSLDVLASSGVERMTGTGALTLSRNILDSIAREVMRGSSALTCSPLVLASAGLERMRGGAAMTVTPLQLAVSGLERMVGSSVMAMVTLVIAGTGNIPGAIIAAALAGKYAREHARALKDIGAAEDASYARQHARALADIAKAGL